jgi:hypothetical protein
MGGIEGAFGGEGRRVAAADGRQRARDGHVRAEVPDHGHARTDADVVAERL